MAALEVASATERTGERVDSTTVYKAEEAVDVASERANEADVDEQRRRIDEAAPGDVAGGRRRPSWLASVLRAFAVKPWTAAAKSTTPTSASEARDGAEATHHDDAIVDDAIVDSAAEIWADWDVVQSLLEEAEATRTLAGRSDEIDALRQRSSQITRWHALFSDAAESTTAAIEAAARAKQQATPLYADVAARAAASGASTAADAAAATMTPSSALHVALDASKRSALVSVAVNECLPLWLTAVRAVVAIESRSVAPRDANAGGATSALADADFDGTRIKSMITLALHSAGSGGGLSVRTLTDACVAAFRAFVESLRELRVLDQRADSAAAGASLSVDDKIVSAAAITIATSLPHTLATLWIRTVQTSRGGVAREGNVVARFVKAVALNDGQRRPATKADARWQSTKSASPDSSDSSASSSAASSASSSLSSSPRRRSQLASLRDILEQQLRLATAINGGKKPPMQAKRFFRRSTNTAGVEASASSATAAAVAVLPDSTSVTANRLLSLSADTNVEAPDDNWHLMMS